MSENQLFFSKIELLAGGLEVKDWDPYRSHQFLWNFFENEPTQKRDFLYRFELDRGKPCYYVVSMRRPKERDFPWRLRVKDYDPVIRFGEILSFNMRVNPTVEKKIDGKRKRHDVVVARKRELGEEWQSKFTQTELMESAGLAWLKRKAELHGFQVSSGSVRVEGYRQRCFHKTSDKQGRKPPITVSSMDFHGLLKVTDPDEFRKTLYNGVGKGKAFGCGLMLVKRR